MTIAINTTVTSALTNRNCTRAEADRDVRAGEERDRPWIITIAANTKATPSVANDVRGEVSNNHRPKKPGRPTRTTRSASRSRRRGGDEKRAQRREFGADDRRTLDRQRFEHHRIPPFESQRIPFDDGDKLTVTIE